MEIIWILKDRDGEIECASTKLSKVMKQAQNWLDYMDRWKMKFVRVPEQNPSMYLIQVDGDEWGMIVRTKLIE